ncbi:hypothetical protein DAI22_08g052600 [Oryza sativa Japonica Group]|nr:hypothetical protein DAI22_08g052600 [Oryza sativa Japonica Group]
MQNGGFDSHAEWWDLWYQVTMTNLIVFANFCLLTFISSDRNVRSVPLFLKKRSLQLNSCRSNF